MMPHTIYCQYCGEPMGECGGDRCLCDCEFVAVPEAWPLCQPCTDAGMIEELY